MKARSLMFGGPVSKVPEAYLAASPISGASPESAPLPLIHGTEDEIIPCGESEHFARELDKRGCPHELAIGNGAGHSFYRELLEGELRMKLVSFLDHTIRPKADS